MSNYKAITTRPVSVEPGRVKRILPTGNVRVESEPLSVIEDVDTSRNCVIMSLESGPNQTLTDHALNKDAARNLMLDLLGALVAVGDPIALTMRDSMPLSVDDIPVEYRREE